MEEIIYKQFIAGIVKHLADEDYVLMEEINKLNLSPEAYALVKKILKDRNINLYLKTPVERETKVSTFDYGEAKTLGMQSLDKPRFSELSFDVEDTPVFQNFDELEKYLLNEFIPKHRQVIKNYHGSGPYYSIQFNKLLDLKLSDIELEYTILFLEQLGIKVRGKNASIDEFENYQYLTTYHYTELPPRLTEEEFDTLLKEYKEKHSKKALDKLIEGNMRLVIMVAVSVYRKCKMVELDDLISVGYLHLGELFDRYDPEKGKFSSYAVKSLRFYMLSEISKYGRQIRIPVNNQPVINKIKRVSDILEDELGRKPTLTEIAQAMGLPEEKVRYLLSNEKEMVDVSDYEIASEDRVVEDKVISGTVMDDLLTALDTLTERESMILKYRFGLVDGHPKDLEEVGKIFGVTRERVRQIEAKALRKLRHPSRLKKIEAYYGTPFPDSRVIGSIYALDTLDGDLEDDFSDGNHIDTIPDYFDEGRGRR